MGLFDSLKNASGSALRKEASKAVNSAVTGAVQSIGKGKNASETFTFVNLEWSIPAWILLAAHFIWNISIWWFVGALGFWILAMISFMWVVGWASECSSHREPPKENKNPYSVKN